MQLIHISLTDYGIFGGENKFDLRPLSDDQFERPIVLFSGKNGVGKTTLSEAIKVCLYGQLALDDKASNSNYKDFIQGRMHQPNSNKNRSNSSGIELKFNHVSLGNPTEYIINRSWEATKSGINETLEISENGNVPKWLDNIKKDSFIRDLIPPQYLDLFFIDGEKIDELIYLFTNRSAVTTVFENYLGISLAKQLQQDLDIFVSKQLDKNGFNGSGKNLGLALKNYKKHNKDKKKLINLYDHKAKEVVKVEKELSKIKQVFASEGGLFAENFHRLEIERIVLEENLDVKHREIQELSSGLLPFIVSPEMLEKVKDRLILEEKYQKHNTVKDLLHEQKSEITSLLNKPELWESLGIILKEQDKKTLITQTKKAISRPVPKSKYKSEDNIINVTQVKRELLLDWIERAKTELPKDFSAILKGFIEIESEIGSIKKELNKVPPNEKIEGIYNGIIEITSQLDSLSLEHEKLTVHLEETENREIFLESEVRRAREALGENERASNQVKMASKAQSLIEEYSRIVIEQKLSILEDAFTKRFNSLCSKDTFIEELKINPDTYSIQLSRKNREFPYTELSAGESQLFVISLIWALHDVSQLSLPIIFDTPLARLDKDHRLSMLIEFLPKASHQLILLATDAEIDQGMIDQLSPVISHQYNLTYDSNKGSTDANHTIYR